MNSNQQNINPHTTNTTTTPSSTDISTTTATTTSDSSNAPNSTTQPQPSSSSSTTTTLPTPRHNHSQFRQVCFNPDISTSSPNELSNSNNSNNHKRNSSSSQDSSKRIRLDTSIVNKPTTNINNNNILSKFPPTKSIRKFRSRSLPIINFNNSNFAFSTKRSKQITNNNNTSNFHSHIHHHHHQSIPPLPPINLQSLKEIDLHEILKNPQLRHDILFDPQLQFRPNLDGERGKRKKSIIEKYWFEIQKECSQYFENNNSIKKFEVNRLPILFTTLRDILLSLLPTKDRQQVGEIMDIELVVQQLKNGSFDFVEMSNWLGEVFKSHCAPMRDQWVIEMIQKFHDAYTFNSVSYLVGGLRMIFQILEAMKLDVANHQIRILRPILIETAIDFEKDYFQTLINHQKINIQDSLNWFYKKYTKKQSSQPLTKGSQVNEHLLKPIIISSIIDLLSCRQMAIEFPSTLAFDHTRLILLRADVRQLVCVQLCIVLYKQLIINSKSSTNLLRQDNITKVQQEILSIVTDDNGNIKWTKNITSISLQLVKNLSLSNPLPKDLIDFSYNWLIKHIQPNSQVYGLMEIKIFKELLSEIVSVIDNEQSTISTDTKQQQTTELKSIASRISTLVKFHWSVFGDYYIDHIKFQNSKLEQQLLLQKSKNNNYDSLMSADEQTQSNDEDANNKSNQNNQNDSNNINQNSNLNCDAIDNTKSAPLSMFS